MTQAIQVKYLPTTACKGVRLKAFAQAGSLIEGRDYGLNVDEQSLELAKSLADKLGWGMPSGSGCLPNGDYVFTFDRVEGA